MNDQHSTLYSRIKAFAIDEPNARFPFTVRLANENGWTLAYARRVVGEYKKFAFLAVAAEHPVTPSDQVDQAWHLHILYTRSYWSQFCKGVLYFPLHHGPTKGGADERRKFEDWYLRTLASYQKFFGPPPEDIWPPVRVRFGTDLNFRRVNTDRFWIVPRPPIAWVIGATAILVATIGFFMVA